MLIASRIDRLLGARMLLALVVVLLPLALAVSTLDALSQMSWLLHGKLDEGQSRTGLIVQMYLLRLPGLLAGIAAVVVAGAGMLAMAPLLRRGQLIALGAAGISPHRTVRAVVLLAVLVGVLVSITRLELAPRAAPRADAIEFVLNGTADRAVAWHERSTGTAWFARQVVLHPERPPVLRDVVIAPRTGGLVLAAGISLRDGAWWLDEPAVVSDAHQQVRHLHGDDLRLSGALALEPDPGSLRRMLLPRTYLTGSELLQRGGILNRADFASRIAAGFLPLLALMASLAVFVRVSSRHNAVVRAVWGCAAGLVSIVVCGLAGIAAQDSPQPELTVLAGLVLAAGWSAWWWLRWRL